jgi:hypothetical protein
MERFTWEALKVTMDVAYTRRKMRLVLAAMEDGHLMAESVQPPSCVRMAERLAGLARTVGWGGRIL